MTLQKANIKPQSSGSSAVANHIHAAEKMDSSTEDKKQISPETILTQKSIPTSSGSSGLPPDGTDNSSKRNNNQSFKSVIQTKLSVSSPGDEYEQEADEVANQVMSKPERDIQKFTTDHIRNFNSPGIHQKEDEEEGTIREKQIFRKGDGPANADPSWLENQLNNSKGNGKSLPGATMASMESRFDKDFSKVKIHTDPNAVQMSKELGAQAFTHGNDIYFNSEKYNPESSSGNHLLAHELTHVIQQYQGSQSVNNKVSRKSGVLVQRAPELSEQPSRETARAIFYTKYEGFLLREDVQWHTMVSFQYGLIILLTPQTINTSSETIANTATNAFVNGGLQYKPGQQEVLFSAIVKELQLLRTGEDSIKDMLAYFIPFDWEFINRMFNYEEFRAFIDSHKEKSDFKFLMPGHLLASGNLPGKTRDSKVADSRGQPETSQPKYKKRPEWLLNQKKNLQARIDKAKKDHESVYLPDSIQEWLREEDQIWFLNIWVNFGFGANEKFCRAIRLVPDETVDSLFERVQQASSQAILKFQDVQQQKSEKQMPIWAQNFKRKIEQAIITIRKREPKVTDIPDGVDLVIERDVARGEGENGGDVKSEPKIFLNIWVERGKTKIQRESGTIPWPITQETHESHVMPMIRQQSAILRQFENDPSAKESIDKPEIVSPDDRLALPAFPAKIIPMNLPADNISVTGAKNSFHMSLDYEAVYGGGELKDLYIASKLHQQTIYFYWRVFEVPKDLKLENDDKKIKTWGEKWLQLYDLYNPHLKDNAEPQSVSQKPPQPGQERFADDTLDSSSKVNFPDEEGDYLVGCITGHAPIGDNKLRRVSSYSYYPVRLKPIKQVGGQGASQRSTAIDNTKTEIDFLNSALSNKDLGEDQKQMLHSVLSEKSAYMERAISKESGSLPDNIDAEISYVSETITKLNKLDSLLPIILDKASKEGTAPSQLLKKQDSSLLDLYWYIIWQKTSVEAYKNELQGKLEQLRKLKGRAREFSNEIKSTSVNQFAPEAAFVSKVTGEMYPLVLMIGEAPDSTSDIIKYSVVDITSKQTQKVYKGISLKKGKEGHKEAIDNAFEDFGSDAKYGEGIIAVRIPPGKAGANNPNHPGEEIKYYNSKEGILQKVLWALGIIGAIAGLAALAATGVGAPVAAAWIGVVAGVAGAVVAVHNLSERKKQHTFAWDFETSLDIVGIVSVIPGIGGLKLTRLAKTVEGFNEYRTLGRLIQVYGWTEIGATALLVPAKLYEDFDKIEKDVINGDLSPEQAKAIKAQLILTAMQTAIMMIGSAAATRYGGKMAAERMSVKERQSLDQQSHFLELEGFGKQYKSLEERGWVDKSGIWTEKGNEAINTATVSANKEPHTTPAGDTPTPAPTPKVETAEPTPAKTTPDQPIVEPEAPLPSKTVKSDEPVGQTDKKTKPEEPSLKEVVPVATQEPLTASSKKDKLKWDDPNITIQQVWEDYKAANPKTGYEGPNDPRFIKRFQNGSRVNPETGSWKKPPVNESNLPDISNQFVTTTMEGNGRVLISTTGELGIPGKVKTHRSSSAQRKVSAGTGEDAGHRIGNRFGAPGGEGNLARQNWKSNEYGTFKKLENTWAEKLHQGVKIKATVTDAYKIGEKRPFMRKVEWTETDIKGNTKSSELYFGNFTTPESRAASGIKPVKGPKADVIPINRGK